MSDQSCQCDLRLRWADPDAPYPEPPPGGLSPYCYRCWAANEVVALFPVYRWREGEGPPPRRGLGDVTAAVLKKIGITPERVMKITGSPCNCNSRQAAMNRWGWKWWHRIKTVFGRRRERPNPTSHKGR